MYFCYLITTNFVNEWKTWNRVCAQSLSWNWLHFRIIQDVSTYFSMKSFHLSIIQTDNPTDQHYVTFFAWFPLILATCRYVDIVDLSIVFSTGSVYSVVAVTVERYTTLNKNNGKVITMPLLTFPYSWRHNFWESHHQGWCGKFWLHKYNLSSVYFWPL